ncbi:DUF4224 domain-containing protein [Paraburkholderia atlantica]|uniref:DUF4224 domain-containing protein n=1 Tax=Paraburkholderia atlantica TaxID=2654982 RepID=UPI003D225B0C
MMTSDQLVDITGKRRFSKQAEWFKANYGVDVVRRDDGSVVMLWATFQALDARKAGLGAVAAKPRVALHYD